MKTNYSVEMSLPSYKENVSGKKIQAQLIFDAVKNGANNLRQLEMITGLPMSTVAGRVNDCIKAETLIYSDFVYYEGRKRKKIILNFKSELF